MTDPNVQTTASGEQVILEPGDPGYVEPQTSVTGEPIDTTPQTVPGSEEPLGGPAPVGQDLQHVRQPGEDDASFAARTRNVAVISESPTDIVPNTPQITMGEQIPVEGAEGVVHTRGPEPEAEVVDEEGEIVEPANGGGAPTERQSAADLIAAAQAAETSEELDAIEAQADGRSTVISAVNARREELANP